MFVNVVAIIFLKCFLLEIKLKKYFLKKLFLILTYQNDSKK